MKKKIKDVKPTKQETIKYVNEDTDQIKKFIFILIGVSIIAALLYFVTAKYLVKDKFQEENETKEEVTLTYDTVRLGNVFNRPYDEYYVFAYDATNHKASYYAALLSNYEDSKIYFMDLSLETNKVAIGENSNKDASKPSELSIKEPTLMLIKDGKISKYYETIEEIEKVIG